MPTQDQTLQELSTAELEQLDGGSLATPATSSPVGPMPTVPQLDVER